MKIYFQVDGIEFGNKVVVFAIDCETEKPQRDMTTSNNEESIAKAKQKIIEDICRFDDVEVCEKVEKTIIVEDWQPIAFFNKEEKPETNRNY